MGDWKLFCCTAAPLGAYSIAPFEAFNILVNKRTMVLDASTTTGPTLPGAVRCDPELPVSEAGAEARTTLSQNMQRDYNPTADVLVLHCDNKERADAVASWLLSTRCRRVRLVHRDGLLDAYPFLTADPAAMTYPNEIVAEQLFLGPVESTNEQALNNLGITHIVSVVDRELKLGGPSREQLLCRIADTKEAELLPVLEKALPFMRAALEGGGKVLVHCEQGLSRSASVVCAHLMVQSDQPTLLDALMSVKAQRQRAQPNRGFVTQLKELDIKTLKMSNDRSDKKRKRRSQEQE